MIANVRSGLAHLVPAILFVTTLVSTTLAQRPAVLRVRAIDPLASSGLSTLNEDQVAEVVLDRRGPATSLYSIAASLVTIAGVPSPHAPSQAPAITSPARTDAPQRIVSLAPSVTEALFASGCGDRVVGVTSYCRYPPETARIAKVGGYITPSYEAIAALRPDLVVMLPEHEDARRHLTALGLHLLELDHRSLRGIIEGLRTLGARCNVDRTADTLVAALQGVLDRIARTTAGRPRPRVVISVARGDERGFGSVSAAGPGGIYDDLLMHAGGQNAVPPGPVLHPALSAESLLRLNPEVIVEFASGAADREAIRRDWRLLGSLNAVRAGRVFVFTEDFLPVPGPRLVRFTEDLARALHSDAQWGTK